MSFFCLLQELYKYLFKGQSPGDPYVERLPFDLHHRFNSSTVAGRANVAKATMAFVSVATLGAYMLGPSAVAALSAPAHSDLAQENGNEKSSKVPAPTEV